MRKRERLIREVNRRLIISSFNHAKIEEKQRQAQKRFYRQFYRWVAIQREWGRQ